MTRAAFARLVRSILLTALLLAAAWIAARAPLPAAHASVVVQPIRQGQVVGQGPNRAAVAVKFGDGHVESRCVQFTEDKIGSDTLLERSGLAPAISPDGRVCMIGSEGCPTDDCWCQCRNPMAQGCTFWAFWRWQNSAWAFSQRGAISVDVQNGDLQGWAWGVGNRSTGAPAPDVTFDQVCSASAGGNTATPTLTPTATATATATATTPPGSGYTGPSAPPQVSFYAAAQTVPPQGCTTLTWQTVDASSVMLDGNPVDLSGSQQVCPASSQTWVLVATNAFGPTSGQVSVQVAAGSTATPTVTVVATGAPSPLPSATPRLALSTPATRLPSLPTRPLVTQAPGPLPTVGQGLLATPGSEPMPLQPAPLEAGVPLAPTAQALSVPVPSPQPTSTRYLFSLPPTETPRPRRAVGAGGGPTPTPILMASLPGRSGQAPAAKAENRPASASGAQEQLLKSRSFSPQLLPGYAAYIATVAVLLSMAWYALQRRNTRSPLAVTESGRHEDARGRNKAQDTIGDIGD